MRNSICRPVFSSRPLVDAEPIEDAASSEIGTDEDNEPANWRELDPTGEAASFGLHIDEQWKKGNHNMVIVDATGVHPIKVVWCGCSDAAPREVQLFELGLFPSSFKSPKTAFTFAVLDDFRLDNLECKTAARRYFNKLQRLTSPAFPQSVPVSSRCRTYSDAIGRSPPHHRIAAESLSECQDNGGISNISSGLGLVTRWGFNLDREIWHCFARLALSWDSICPKGGRPMQTSGSTCAAPCPTVTSHWITASAANRRTTCSCPTVSASSSSPVGIRAT